MIQKFKSIITNDAYFTVILILLVGITSFGLGRLSMAETQVVDQIGVGFQEVEPVQPQTSAQEVPIAVPIVVSKSGSKYHLFDCPGAKQMKEENRIEFPSIDAAKAAGYTAAANCPGLQ